MKIRNGFISNSSSSSFVICGYIEPKIDIEKVISYIQTEYPKIYDDTLKYYDADCEEFIIQASYSFYMPIKIRKGNSENGLPEDMWVIGKILASIDSSEGYIDTQIIDLDTMNDLKDLKTKLNLKSSMKIIIGTECC